MEAYIADWLNLVIRWLHVITGIAWIGSSFFFNWLDMSLEKPEDKSSKVEGSLWMVHGGGFYNMEKLQLAPDEIPPRLHWVKWEAGFTWISGMLLIALLYWWGAKTFMVDPQIAATDPREAVLLAIAVLFFGWVIYDQLWQSPLAGKGWLPIIISLVVLAAATWLLSHLLSGRAAFLHIGAMMGTIMVGNVWVRIIPGQQKLVKATEEGRQPDPYDAQNAKRRSTHNNYMTLPVVLLMFSAHYPMTFGHEYNWLVLLALVAIGAGVRHFFNLRNRGIIAAWIPATAAVAMVALAVAIAPSFTKTAPEGTVAARDAVPFAVANGIVALRCGGCHAARPTAEGFEAPPKGVMFDTPAQIKAQVEKILQQTIKTRVMPIGNLTNMTDEERGLLGKWIEQGAAIPGEARE